MSIGSETAGGVSGVTVRRCTFQDTENALRIKSPRGKGGVVENVLYADLTMNNVQPAILFTCYYPHIPEADTAQPVGNGTPSFRNIRVVNVTATCAKSAGMIVGLPESLVKNVVLENVRISAPTGLSIYNASGIKLKNVKVTTEQGKSFMLRNAQVDGIGAGQAESK
jgi:polygalacturonase